MLVLKGTWLLALGDDLPAVSHSVEVNIDNIIAVSADSHLKSPHLSKSNAMVKHTLTLHTDYTIGEAASLNG